MASGRIRKRERVISYQGANSGAGGGISIYSRVTLVLLQTYAELSLENFLFKSRNNNTYHSGHMPCPLPPTTFNHPVYIRGHP